MRSAYWLTTLICTDRLDVINGQTFKWEYIIIKHTDDGNLMVAVFLSQHMAKVQVFLEGHKNLELSLPYIQRYYVNTKKKILTFMVY